MHDLEARSYGTATWIPLKVSDIILKEGRSGYTGYRKEFASVDCLIVPLSRRNEFERVDWQSVNRSNGDGAWVDEERFIPPGCYSGDFEVRYPVIERMFDTEAIKEWDLFQELEVGLQLSRRGDVWIRPDENDAEVARLKRNDDGRPASLSIKAEYLRDYLCARRAAMLLTAFCIREAVEADFEPMWPEKPESRQFSSGNWDGGKVAIHEGGRPFGMRTAVLHMWRESVNPADDVPEMPHPCAEPAARSREYKVDYTGQKLWMVNGRIWTKHWVEPAALSPRIGRDRVESRVQFLVENQEQKTLAGQDLEDHRGWLWFRPTAMKVILQMPKAEFEWYTGQTGMVGPASNATLHFGINKLGLINVLAYKMAGLPEWAQRIWVSHNVIPEGGISEELHMSQNLASPARTVAPEVGIWQNLNELQARALRAYGVGMFHRLPREKDFYKIIHRFHWDSFEDLCKLCKEIHRIVSEQFDIGAINATIDPVNAEKANQDKLRQIKRVAFWLTGLGFDGRKMTQTLAAISELRQGDAHGAGSDLRDALEMLGIRKDSTNYPAMCWHIMAETANTIAAIAEAISGPGQNG